MVTVGGVASIGGNFTVLQPPNITGLNPAFGPVGGSVTINGANVLKTDIVCGNGVIHVIDAVLLPK